MVSRLVMLILIFSARGIWWCIENPKGSCIQYHPRFQWLLGFLDVHRHYTELRYFNGDTLKGLWLFCPDPWISEIDEFRTTDGKITTAPKDMVVYGCSSSGVRTYHGGHDLKASQYYPDDFGKAVLKLYTKHESDIKRRASILLEQAASAMRDTCKKTRAVQNCEGQGH